MLTRSSRTAARIVTRALHRQWQRQSVGSGQVCGYHLPQSHLHLRFEAVASLWRMLPIPTLTPTCTQCGNSVEVSGMRGVDALGQAAASRWQVLLPAGTPPMSSRLLVVLRNISFQTFMVRFNFKRDLLNCIAYIPVHTSPHRLAHTSEIRTGVGRETLEVLFVLFRGNGKAGCIASLATNKACRASSRRDVVVAATGRRQNNCGARF